jgi:GntR family transcriptional regulator, histidine utilization repressor
VNDVAVPPLGERIRCDLETRIVSGAWPPGHRIPSEHALMAEYSCSRMTMHKVLSGMASAGLIIRRRRVGSFVSAPRGDRSIPEIQDFATEAARLGQVYRHEIQSRKLAALVTAEAAALGLRAGSRVVRLRCLHRMNGIPSAYEDRLISLAAVPAADGTDFQRVPRGTWLLQNVPWTEAEHVIRARNATRRLSRLLQLKPNAACLVL